MSRSFNGGFLAGLVFGGMRGYSIGRQIKQDQAVDAVMEAKPEQSQGYTADDGSKLEALAGAKDAQGNALYTIGADADGNYTVTPITCPSAWPSCARWRPRICRRTGAACARRF